MEGLLEDLPTAAWNDIFKHNLLNHVYNNGNMVRSKTDDKDNDDENNCIKSLLVGSGLFS